MFQFSTTMMVILFLLILRIFTHMEYKLGIFRIFLRFSNSICYNFLLQIYLLQIFEKIKFWNFYNKNNLVVLHNKPNTVDLQDKVSKILIVEGMSSQMYRKCFVLIILSTKTDIFVQTMSFIGHCLSYTCLSVQF